MPLFRVTENENLRGEVGKNNFAAVRKGENAAQGFKGEKLLIRKLLLGKKYINGEVRELGRGSL